MNEEGNHSLNKQALTGAVWTYVQQFGTVGIQLIVTIILARLLGPKEFGLIGMLGIFIQIAAILVQSGLTSSIIRSKQIDDDDLSTVFFFNLVLSLILYGVIYLGAPLVAIFYKQAILTQLLRVLSITIVINAFSVVQISILTKELQFKRQTFIAFAALIISAVIAILLAYKGFGVWSLIWNTISNATISGILFWGFSKWKPKWIFSQSAFKRHFNFGYKLSLSGLLNVLFENLYIVTIGKIFPPASLGYYTQANTLRNIPLNTISSALNKVTFPYFSKLNDDVELKKRLRQVINFSLFITAPLLVLIAIMSNEVIGVLFSAKWLPAAPYLSLLCLAGLFYPVHAFNLNILLVKGKSKEFLVLEIIKKVLIVISIILTYRFGIVALIIGQIILMFLATPINGYYLNDLIQYNMKEQFADLLFFTTIATVIGALLYAIKINFMNTWNVYFVIIVISALYLGLYLLFSKILRPTVFTFSKNILVNIKQK